MNEIVEFWGFENLKRWPEAAVSPLKISQASKEYLINVGLPKKLDRTIRFGTDFENFPRLDHKPHYRVIGFDLDNSICIDEQKNGRVVCVYTEKASEALINSSVELLGEFLTQDRKFGKLSESYYEGKSENLTEEDIQKAFLLLEKRLQSLDPAAFGDDDNVWPILLGYAKDELGL